MSTVNGYYSGDGTINNDPNYSSIDFPPNPAGTDSGSVPWDIDWSSLYNASGTGQINILNNFAMYISAHPGSWTAMLDLNKAYVTIVDHYKSLGQAVPQQIQSFMSQGGWGQEMMLDGIEIGASFAFKNGYTDASGTTFPPGEASYKAFMQDWQTSLSGYTSDPIISAVSTDLQADLGSIDPTKPNPFNADAYYKAHLDPTTNQLGTEINGIWYDYNTTDDNQMFTIDSQILYATPGNDIANLQNILGSLEKQNIVNTIDSIKATGGAMEIIMLILAFMGAGEAQYLNQIGGNNDIGNMQHEYNTRFVTSIQNAVQGIGGWSNDGTTGDDSAGELRDSINELIANQQMDPQFKSLDGTMGQFVQYLKNNSVTFDDPITKKKGETVTLYDLFTSQTNGAPTYNNQQVAAALKQGLAPNPTSSDPGQGTSPNAQELQGFLGSINAFSTTFTSLSTQLTTLTSQITQLLQALYKLGDGAVDPKNGLNAVAQTAVSKQTIS